MATVPEETHEFTIDAVKEWWSGALDHLEEFAPWLVVGASLLAYLGLYAVVVGGAMIGSVYLALAVSGMARYVVFFLIGIPLVGTGHTLANRLYVEILG